LFITADLLEVQTADRTAWFLSYEPNSLAEDIDLQSIHSHLSSVEPSSMIPELGQDTLHRILPPGIRSCVRAHIILRKWLVAFVAAPGIGLGRRQARIELLLRCIEICRLRDEKNGDGSSFSIDRPVVRSFAEAILTSAILSSESRAYHRAWQNVATARSANVDSLDSLLSNHAITTSSTSDGLTIDIGWVLESILEIVSTPDVIDGSSEPSRSLINFEKRR
jgi:GTPase-activating protein BEM2